MNWFCKFFLDRKVQTICFYFYLSFCRDSTLCLNLVLSIEFLFDKEIWNFYGVGRFLKGARWSSGRRSPSICTTRRRRMSPWPTAPTLSTSASRRCSRTAASVAGPCLLRRQPWHRLLGRRSLRAIPTATRGRMRKKRRNVNPALVISLTSHFIIVLPAPHSN